MGILRANPLGILLSIGTVVVSVVLGSWLNMTTVSIVYLIGGLMIVVDLLVRWRSTSVSGWRKLLSAKAGGQFVILPVWGLGILFLLIGFSE